jgi:DNA-binding NtrC family response regulator
MYSVLVVDDDKGVLSLLKRVLVANKFNVTTTSEPLSAIATIAKENIDILLSDIDMPGISGIDLVSTVRKEFPHVVRILMTGKGSMDVVVRAINEGEIFRYLAKPFDSALLLSTLQGAGERVEEQRALKLASKESGLAARLKNEIMLEYPGIEKITRSSDGVYVVDLEGLRNKKDQLPPEIQKLLLQIS